MGAYLEHRELAEDVETYIADEQRLGRLLDYAGDRPAVAEPVRRSAEELREPGLLELVRDGSPIYAWRFEERHVWHSPQMPLMGRILERATKVR